MCNCALRALLVTAPDPWPVGTIVAMLYQQVRPPFWQRHPVVTGAAAVVTVWLLWTGAQVLVAAAGSPGWLSPSAGAGAPTRYAMPACVPAPSTSTG